MTVLMSHRRAGSIALAVMLSAMALAGFVCAVSLAVMLSAMPVAAQTAARLDDFVLPATQPSRALCVRDAVSGEPVTFARLQTQDHTAPDSLARRASRVWAESCGLVAVNIRLSITRLGYLPWQGLIAAADDTLMVGLQPIAAPLAAAETRAWIPGDDAGGGRNAVVLSVDSARRLGVHSSGSLVQLLPYTFPRSARGEVSLSLRGARREQVAVTLDGVPLTDPSTGIADLADVPLAALSSVTVAPGSDPLGNGPGAAGGVLALQSGNTSVATMRMASYGDRSVEGAWKISGASSALRLTASHRVAQNDFDFVNASGTTGTRTEEQRVNNDVARSSVMAQWRSSHVQITALGSRTKLGLVGPVNVRDYDEDRSTTERLFVRASAQAGGTLLSSGVRSFALRYTDPSRPAFNTSARALAADVDARRHLGRLLVHGGVGTDRLRTSREVSQDRRRGFVSATASGGRVLEWTAGARADAISGSGVLPSFSLSATRELAHGDVGVRMAQAVRVPTLYDLYFSSPQRLTVRALEAERVSFDGELHGRWHVRSTSQANDATPLRLTLEGALVARTTRDAIVWFPGNFGWSPANVGTEQLRGVEARADAAFRTLSVKAWSTVYEATLMAGALRIPTPYVPRVAAGTTTSVRAGPVIAALSSRWLGRRPYTAGPRNPDFELPAVQLLDVAVSTAPRLGTREFLLTLGVENLTNRAWQSVRGFPAAGRVWSVALTLSP